MTGGGRWCTVLKCGNCNRKLKKWKETVCEIHLQELHKDCTCVFPFYLFPFPKNEKQRHDWLVALNRKDFKPGKGAMVCSLHFIDGRPTAANPIPQINMGFEKKIPVLEDNENMTTGEILLPELPISSFYLFCLDEKPKIIKTFPDKTPKAEVMKELGRRFLTCPQANLAKYDSLAKADFLRYEKELKEYQDLCDENKQKLEDSLSAKVQSSKRKRSAGISNRATETQRSVEAPPERVIPSPIEPLSAFFWFCLEKKLTNVEQSLTLIDLASKLSKQWQKSTPAVQSKFEKLAEIDQLRYEKDVIVYHQKKTESTSLESDTEIDEASDSNVCSDDTSISNCVDPYGGVEPGGVEDLLEIKLEYASDQDN